WGGSFNGGSDYMTILVLLTSTSAFLLPQYSHYIWIYLGVQVVLSYFISGVVKLKQPTWRSGESLLYLIQSSNYQIPDKTKHLITNKKVAAALSWVVIIFEISSPLVLLSPNICFFYLVIATTFHIANFYVFGLNRFIFAWLASYPALVYLTFMIH
ncbi:MAG: HTTM domain-containing protein, partial [Bdellovibrionales bacterium]|nr:HTTM domain-containing protein [Bdellovibrionales bacterium]